MSELNINSNTSQEQTSSISSTEATGQQEKTNSAADTVTLSAIILETADTAETITSTESEVESESTTSSQETQSTTADATVNEDGSSGSGSSSDGGTDDGSSSDPQTEGSYGAAVNPLKKENDDDEDIISSNLQTIYQQSKTNQAMSEAALQEATSLDNLIKTSPSSASDSSSLGIGPNATFLTSYHFSQASKSLEEMQTGTKTASVSAQEIEIEVSQAYTAIFADLLENPSSMQALLEQSVDRASAGIAVDTLNKILTGEVSLPNAEGSDTIQEDDTPTSMELAYILGAFAGASSDAQVTASEYSEVASDIAAKTADASVIAANAALDDAIEEQEKMDKMSKKQKFWGDVIKWTTVAVMSVAVVALIATAPATGGASLIAAGMLATSVVQMAQGGNSNIIMDKLVEGLQKVGLSKQDAQIVAIVGVTAIMAVSAGGGIGLLGGGGTAIGLATVGGALSGAQMAGSVSMGASKIGRSLGMSKQETMILDASLNVAVGLASAGFGMGASSSMAKTSKAAAEASATAADDAARATATVETVQEASDESASTLAKTETLANTSKQNVDDAGLAAQNSSDELAAAQKNVEDMQVEVSNLERLVEANELTKNAADENLKALQQALEANPTDEGLQAAVQNAEKELDDASQLLHQTKASLTEAQGALDDLKQVEQLKVIANNVKQADLIEANITNNARQVELAKAQTDNAAKQAELAKATSDKVKANEILAAAEKVSQNSAKFKNPLNQRATEVIRHSTEIVNIAGEGVKFYSGLQMYQIQMALAESIENLAETNVVMSMLQGIAKSQTDIASQVSKDYGDTISTLSSSWSASMRSQAKGWEALAEGLAK